MSPEQSKRGYKTAFILITCLFFMWGLSYGLVDVLNKHFQDVLKLTKTQAGFTQAAYFGAYFVVAMPAAFLMSKLGYKAGILLGLALYAIGAVLFVPAAAAASFPMFLGAFFVLALGLGCLETGANPYSAALGDPDTSERRLNLSQAFNGLGQFAGPLIGGMLFLGEGGSGQTAAESLAPVKTVYVVIACVVAGLFIFIALTKLPDLRDKEEETDAGETADQRPLRAHKEFWLGVLALFCYMGAQVGIGAFCINLTLETWPGSNAQTGAWFLSIGMFCLLAGRFIGTALMSKIQPHKLLMVYGAASTVLTIVICFGIEKVSIIALMAVFFFISIMFPTIFAMGVKYLGSRTKLGSSFMIMAIVGGGIAPYFMGIISDNIRASLAYALPVIFFAVITMYGAVYKKAAAKSMAGAKNAS